ncbi:MAG: ABC transporter substrate-binding protein [Ferrimicrobium sp.]
MWAFKRLNVLVAASLGLLLASCGGSTAGSSQASATQGVHGKTILIGSSAILSGPDAPYSGITVAMNDYFNYVNTHGGINGYKFQVVQEDNAYVASQAVAVARDLVFNHKVFALSVVGTTPSQATLPLHSQLKVPIMIVANADLVPKPLPNVFGFEPSFTRDALFDAHYAMSVLHVKKVAYAYETTDIGEPPLTALAPYVKSQGGKLVATVGFSVTATDYSSEAAKLQASGAKAVIVYSGVTQVASLQKAAAAIGYYPKWFAFFGAFTPAYPALAGPVSNGTYVDDFLEDPAISSPSMKLFTQNVAPSLVGLLGELGWTDASLIGAGVKGATANGGKLTYASFEHAMVGLTNKQVGVWPSVTFSANSHSGSTSSTMYKVVNGHFVPATGLEQLPALP